MNTQRAAADHKAIEAIIYANAIRGDVAAFTAAIADVPTRRLRAAYRAAFDHLPEAWTGNRATMISRACARCCNVLAGAPTWRSPIDTATAAVTATEITILEG